MIAEGVTLACPFITRQPDGVFLMWEVTRKCNLSCRHCITSAGDAIAGELDARGLADLAEGAAACGVSHVYLTGGEPLLKDGVWEVIERLRADSVAVTLATNGSTIDERSAERLARLEVTVNVSLDHWRAEYHDAMRGGTGTFDTAVAALLELSTAGSAVRASCMVTAHNFGELHRMCAFFAWLRADGVIFSPIHSLGRAAADHSWDAPARSYFAISRELSRLSRSFAPFLDVSYPRFSGREERAPLNRCYGGEGVFYLDAAGWLTPCTYEHKRPDHVGVHAGRDLGGALTALRASSWRQRARERAASRPERCRTCELEVTCGRGCPVFADHYLGSWDEVDPLCPETRHVLAGAPVSAAAPAMACGRGDTGVSGQGASRGWRHGSAHAAGVHF